MQSKKTRKKEKLNKITEINSQVCDCFWLMVIIEMIIVMILVMLIKIMTVIMMMMIGDGDDDIDNVGNYDASSDMLTMMMTVMFLHYLTAIPNPCAVNNGGCSHLCLLSPSGEGVCACPDNHFLDNNGNCQTACTNIQLYCEADSYCYPFYLHCDGKNDCSDGSDEIGCGKFIIHNLFLSEL